MCTGIIDQKIVLSRATTLKKIFWLLIQSVFVCHSKYRTEHKAKRSEHFLKIHDYLQRICTESYLQGLKYFGGPEVKCKCLGSDRKPLVRVLKFAEYIGETQTCKTRREVKCRKCFQLFKLDEMINKQVSLFVIHSCCQHDESFYMQIPKPESHTINGDEAHTPLPCKLAVSTTTGVSNVDPQTGIHDNMQPHVYRGRGEGDLWGFTTPPYIPFILSL